ncbi:MAG: family 14 glycosylhydrolase [Candidatus Obscuribacterales bacterium]|nr:family 14 glycosylhydrolase [Candidatus Obscuribacterales bacterium]
MHPLLLSLFLSMFDYSNESNAKSNTSPTAVERSLSGFSPTPPKLLSEKNANSVSDNNGGAVTDKEVAERTLQILLAQSSQEMKAASAQASKEHARPSILKTGLDAVTSKIVKSDELREQVNHYGAELVKTASLFAGGKVGFVSTIVSYGLDQAKYGDSLKDQAIDFTLGGAKGTAMKGIFAAVGSGGQIAPVKGVMMGLGSGAADVVFSRESLNNPAAISDRLKSDVFTAQSILFNAATFTVGQGVFSGVNHLSKGALASNKLLSGMVTGGSFGFVNGSSAEALRQVAEKEDISFSKMLLKGGLEASVGAAGAGIGIKASDPAFHASLRKNVYSALDVVGLNPAPNAREFVVTRGMTDVSKFANEQTSTALTTVREVRNILGWERIGPEKQLLLHHNEQTNGRIPVPKLADLLATCNPENLTSAQKAAHLFPDAKGPVFLEQGQGNRIRLATSDAVPQWKNSIGGNRVMLGGYESPINVMAPLLVGDPFNPNGDKSRPAWDEFVGQLNKAKKLGVNGVSTDVWWGVIEPKQGQFDWRYYDKLSSSIINSGLKWVPILSFHQLGGNVGDTHTVPIPFWTWNKISSQIPGSNADVGKFKSENGNMSSEYIQFAADKYAIPLYKNVMNAFQQQYASKAPHIAEINISLGPAGEARYPSYNQHDPGADYPSRGALQAYSDLQKADFVNFVMKKYGNMEGVEKAWGTKVGKIEPPVDASAFYRDQIHTKTQYGRDFFDWYSGSLVNHIKGVLGESFSVFSNPNAPFKDVEIGAKIPGVHWRIGTKHADGRIELGDRLAELNAGLIRTSTNDWGSDALGRGYRPLLSGIKEAATAPGAGRFTLHFTCLEMLDGQGGPEVKALPNTLANWVGREAKHQGLLLKGENALNYTLHDWAAWNSIRDHMQLHNKPGLYKGLTILRINDVINTAAEPQLKALIEATKGPQPPAGAPALKPAG